MQVTPSKLDTNLKIFTESIKNVNIDYFHAYNIKQKNFVQELKKCFISDFVQKSRLYPKINLRSEIFFHIRTVFRGRVQASQWTKLLSTKRLNFQDNKEHKASPTNFKPFRNCQVLYFCSLGYSYLVINPGAEFTFLKVQTFHSL